jgi:predicted Zn-dependent protease
MKKLLRNTFNIFATIILLFAFSKTANAEGISIIRDDETERFLLEITKPIFKVAGLNYENIRIYIINNNSINAFVSGGQNVFINTGLIEKYKTPDVLTGVLAHEVGHIAAGHLVAGSQNYQNNAMLFGGSVVLATVAALAGSPDTSQAIVMGGLQVAQQNVLKFSRTQEESADQLAVDYLRQIGVSPVGLLEAMNDFERYDIQNYDRVDEYSQTHPVSSDRIQHIKSYIKKGENNKRFNAKYKDEFDRIRIKLESFLGNPSDFLKKYQFMDDDVSRYGKAIAYYRIFQKQKALDEIDYLIAREPKNPYFYELKGQILFETQEPDKAIEPYIMANDLLPDSPLIKISLSNAILALDEEKLRNLLLPLHVGVDEARTKSDAESVGVKLNDKTPHGSTSSQATRFACSPTRVERQEILKQVQDDKNCGNPNSFAIQNLQEALNIERDNTMAWWLLAKAYNNEKNQGMSYLSLSEYYLRRQDSKNAVKYAELAKKNLKESNYITQANDIILQAGKMKNNK